MSTIKKEHSETGGNMSLNDEMVSRSMLAADPNRAAYYWMVRDATNAATLPVSSLPVIIAEYDAGGALHKLAEIVLPPPYMWCAQSYRETQGIGSRNILIPAGYEPIWGNRVRVKPDGTSQGCLMFGRRNIATRAEEVLLLYPDGTSFQLASMQDAIAH